MEQGDTETLLQICHDYAAAARVDMGFKHFAFILGAIGNRFNSAKVHAYGPLYGSGAAVIEFDLTPNIKHPRPDIQSENHNSPPA